MASKPIATNNCSSISAYHSVHSEQVLLGCGSTEILRVAAETFGGPGRQVMQASPTFESFAHYAQLAGSEVVSVPLTAKFFGNYSPSRDKRLGQSSGNAINVEVGQIVLVRNVKDPTTIYVLKIEGQEEHEAMTVQYFVLPGE